MTFKELKKEFTKHFNGTRLSDIAHELEVSPQVVNNWKNRNQVPYKYVIALREKIKKHDRIGKSQTTYVIEKEQKEIFQDEYSSKEIIKDIIISLINNYKIVILLTFLITTGTFINVMYLVEEVYVSTSKILTLGSSSKTKIGGIASQFGISIPSSSGAPDLNLTEIFPEILRSRQLADSLLNQKFSSSEYGKNVTLFKIFNKRYFSGLKDSSLVRFLAISKISKDIINVKIDKFVPIITISTQGFNPKFASELNKAVINALKNVSNKIKFATNDEKMVFIEQRFNEVLKDLQDSEEKIKIFRERNRNINKSPALLLEQERLMRDLNVKSQIFITLKQEYEILQIDMVGKENLMVVIEPPIEPISRTSPRRKESIIFAIIFSVLIGIVVAFLKENFDIINKIKYIVKNK